MMNGIISGIHRPIRAAGNAHAVAKNSVTAITAGSIRIQAVGATP